MTPKEAAEVIKNPLKYGMEERTEADRMAAEALEKVEKYRWHDLRKNPDDLPLVGYTVLAWFDDGNAYTCVRYNDCWAYSEYDCLREVNEENDKNIIAWREIDPFNEVNE